MCVHSASGKVPDADWLAYQFPTADHPVQGVLQRARYTVSVLGAAYHHGGGAIQPCTKVHHCGWTRVGIQVRIEVGKTIQRVTKVNVDAWKRCASRKP